MTIKLKNSLKVNGKDVKELQFDTDVFTIVELERANKKLAQLNKNAMFVQETDPDYHFIIASLIIEKSSNNEILSEDLRRLKGADLIQLQRYGRDFLLESVVQDQETSEEQSEVTAKSTEQAR